MNNFEKPQTVEEKENFFYPEIEYRREPILEIFSKLLNKEEKSKELSYLLELADEEALYWLVMTFNHPEREDAVFLKIKEDKEYIENPKQIQEELFKILEKNKSEISQNINDVDKKSIEDEYSERIKKLIKYFKPVDFESRVQKVIKVDADDILSKKSGYAIMINKEAFILSHSTNKDNFDHEFMHTFINSIVDKLIQERQFSEDEKNQIMETINPKLREHYEDDFKSCLCEVIVRTYNDWYKSDSEKYVGSFPYESNNRTYNLYKKYSNQEPEKAVDFETFLLNNKDFLLK
jgi:hypothetical protein